MLAIVYVNQSLHSIPIPISSRDEIGVVDSIEVVDMV